MCFPPLVLYGLRSIGPSIPTMPTIMFSLPESQSTSTSTASHFTYFYWWTLAWGKKEARTSQVRERKNVLDGEEKYFSETNSNHFFLSEDICPCKTNHSLTAFGRKRGQIPKTKKISNKFLFFSSKKSKVRILGTAENRFLPMVQKHFWFHFEQWQLWTELDLENHSYTCPNNGVLVGDINL